MAEKVLAAVESKPRILIADDEAANVSTLVETLRDYAALTIARNGTEAYERGCSVVPDLFLLDIKMPGLDGYEVCGKIRETDSIRNVPVIFITSLDAEEDESHGFAVGANDYVTKPFCPSLVMARAKTQIDLKLHRDHLEALAAERARALVHAERLATLGTLAAGIAHEINNPLTCIWSLSELLDRNFRKNIQEQLPALREAVGGDNPVVQYLDNAGQQIPMMLDSCSRIKAIVSSMKSYSKREGDHPVPVNLATCVENSLQLCLFTTKYGIETPVDIPADLPAVLGQMQQIEQVLINLINNAAHAIQERSQEGVIAIKAREVDHNVVLTVEDSGPGIPLEKLDTIWEAFYTSKGDKGTGLGLSISKGIIEEHHGNIMVENRTEGGARFVITLPAHAG